MKQLIIDSNIILDVFLNDKDFAEKSSAKLAECADDYQLLINPIIYAEVSGGFKSIEELESSLSVLSDHDFCKDALPWEAAFRAEKAFLKYRKNGDKRETLLADFFIGAHAEVYNVPILTRDEIHYKKYFPKVKLISP